MTGFDNRIACVLGGSTVWGLFSAGPLFLAPMKGNALANCIDSPPNR